MVQNACSLCHTNAFLIIVVGATQVGLVPALVTHEEVEIWAEGKEVEEETRDLDDWEIAERKAARAKIVAVPSAKFNTCFGPCHDFRRQTIFGHYDRITRCYYRLYLLYVLFAHMLRTFTLVIGAYL